MSRHSDANMEVRSLDTEWNPAAPDTYVVRLTDQGWKHFADHGFSADCRAALNDASSLIFLDFEERAGFIAGSEMNRRCSAVQKFGCTFLAKINAMLPAARYHDADLRLLLETRTSVEKLVNHADDQRKRPKNRQTREAIYNYVERLCLLRSISGGRLTRGEKSESFLGKIFHMHATPLLLYLRQIENIPPLAIEAQVSLLRQQRPETTLKKRLIR
jgi:hypothetical protein